MTPQIYLGILWGVLTPSLDTTGLLGLYTEVVVVVAEVAAAGVKRDFFCSKNVIAQPGNMKMNILFTKVQI